MTKLGMNLAVLEPPESIQRTVETKSCSHSSPTSSQRVHVSLTWSSFSLLRGIFGHDASIFVHDASILVSICSSKTQTRRAMMTRMEDLSLFGPIFDRHGGKMSHLETHIGPSDDHPSSDETLLSVIEEEMALPRPEIVSIIDQNGPFRLQIALKCSLFDRFRSI